MDIGPNYNIASTKSQHKEILKNPESSADQAVNQQLIWLQQTSGEYQHWRKNWNKNETFWGEMARVKTKQQNNQHLIS